MNEDSINVRTLSYSLKSIVIFNQYLVYQFKLCSTEKYKGVLKVRETITKLDPVVNRDKPWISKSLDIRVMKN